MIRKKFSYQELKDVYDKINYQSYIGKTVQDLKNAFDIGHDDTLVNDVAIPIDGFGYYIAGLGFVTCPAPHVKAKTFRIGTDTNISFCAQTNWMPDTIWIRIGSDNKITEIKINQKDDSMTSMFALPELPTYAGVGNYSSELNYANANGAHNQIKSVPWAYSISCVDTKTAEWVRNASQARTGLNPKWFPHGATWMESSTAIESGNRLSNLLAATSHKYIAYDTPYDYDGTTVIEISVPSIDLLINSGVTIKAGTVLWCTVGYEGAVSVSTPGYVVDSTFTATSFSGYDVMMNALDLVTKSGEDVSVEEIIKLVSNHFTNA